MYLFRYMPIYKHTICVICFHTVSAFNSIKYKAFCGWF